MKYYITTKPFVAGSVKTSDADTPGMESFTDALEVFEMAKTTCGSVVLFSVLPAGGDHEDIISELVTFQRTAYTANSGEIYDKIETEQSITDDLSRYEYDVYRSFYQEEEARSYIRDVDEGITEPRTAYMP